MCYQLANFMDFIKYHVHLIIELHTSTEFLELLSFIGPEKETMALIPISQMKNLVSGKPSEVFQ